MVRFRYIIANTVHKGDSKDDDDDNDNNNNNKNNKAKVIPVTRGATGPISKIRHYLGNVPGKHEIKELQKTATLCTAHIYCGKC